MADQRGNRARSSIYPPSFRTFIAGGLSVLLLLVAQAAHAQVTYLSVSPTTTGGVAGAGGTLSAGISFSVKAAVAPEYVLRVELYDGSTLVNAVNYSAVIGGNGEQKWSR